jgi:hypothetical protein
MAKFTETGDLLWKKNLPGTLYGVRKGLSLPSGGFILAGTDSSYRQTSSISNGITNIALFDNDGNNISSLVIVSNPSSSDLLYYLDFTLLANGNIAFLINPQGLGNLTYPRLLILNQNLTTVFDQVYYTAQGAPFTGLSMPLIQEGLDGSIYIGYTYYNGTNSSTALMKLKAIDYSFDYLKSNLGFGISEIPGSMAIDKNGNCIIASSRVTNPSQQFASYYRSEYYALGPEISVIRTDTSGSNIDRHNYSGYPLLGSLMKIIRTRDGGFIMTGTSNQNESFTITSNTQVLLVKTDANLNKQWMKQFDTTYPSIGYDVIETKDGGYAIGAFEKSFNTYFKMMIIKTDANGN